MGNIFLIGFMGSGKTSVAAYLHNRYGLTVCETDQEIARREGKSIPEIFAQHGEEYFRQAETSLLKELCGRDGLIVSGGGGMAMRQENVALMKRGGKIVYLKADPKTIYTRVSGFPRERPLLKGHMDVEYISALMEKRRPFYEAAADLVISVDHRTIEEAAEEIYHSPALCLGF